MDSSSPAPANGPTAGITTRQKRKTPDDPLTSQIADLIIKMTGWKADLDSGMSQINDKIDSVLKTELSSLTTQTNIMQNEITNLRKDYASFGAKLTSFEEEVSNMKSSIEFQSSLHTDLVSKVKTLETCPQATDLIKSDISELRNEINSLQQRERFLNLEIMGLPERKNELLLPIFMKIASYSGVSLSVEDIVHITRVQPRQHIQGRPKAVIVKLQSRNIKGNILSSIRKCRGISTNDIGLPGETRQIFINEHLTVENKALLKKTKELARSKQYQYIWIKNCQIFARKSDTSPAILVRREDDLKKIT